MAVGLLAELLHENRMVLSKARRPLAEVAEDWPWGDVLLDRRKRQRPNTILPNDYCSLNTNAFIMRPAVV